MEKIDRLGWAAGESVVSYGWRIGVRTSAKAILPRLLERLPPGVREAPGPVVHRLYSFVLGGSGSQPGLRRFHLLYAGSVQIARTFELEEALAAFESDVRLYVAERARRRVFVHAGVVGYKGRAIVIPGRSFSGKSRMVAALLDAGATYYSDEYAVFDAKGRVHPFAAPLSFREDGGGSRRTAAAALGSVGKTPLPVGLVALSEYRPGSRWRPRRLSEGHGLLALLSHTVPARRRPGFALQTLKQVVAGTPVLKSRRGEARQAVPALLKALG